MASLYGEGSIFDLGSTTGSTASGATEALGGASMAIDPATLYLISSLGGGVLDFLGNWFTKKKKRTQTQTQTRHTEPTEQYGLLQDYLLNKLGVRGMPVMDTSLTDPLTDMLKNEVLGSQGQTGGLPQ